MAATLGYLQTAPQLRGGPDAGGRHLGGQLASDLRRLFLELGSEDARQQKASHLLQRSSEREAMECLPLILDRLVNFTSAHGLGIHCLHALLRLHPIALVQYFEPKQVYDLFNPGLDDGPGAAFLHALLCYRESQGLSAEQEGGKLQRLLLRRAKHSDPRRLPPSALRAWLSKIWLDVKSSRPSDHQLMIGCCARWIADPSVSPAEKMPCFELIRQDFGQRGRPEADAWLVSTLLEQVCRDPSGHSRDLQHLLWPLGPSGPSAAVLKPLLGGLAQERGRLASLWVCLCLWPPWLGPPPEGMCPVPWPQSAPPPVHSLLRAMLESFSQLAASDDLCRTCVLTLGAIAASGDGPVVASACDLLLHLHVEGPLLPSSVWAPLMPMLENLLAPRSAKCAELLQRLRRKAGGGAVNGFGGHPQQLGAQGFGSAGGAFGGLQPAPGAGYAQPQPQPQPQPQAAHAQQSPCPPDAIVGKYEPPRVGLQNTNNTCYMNSFIQSLYLTNRFVWRLFNFQLTLKKNPSKVDKEDHEFGIKVVDLMRMQMAKMMLTRHKHTDIWDILQGFPAEYRSGEQQDVTETVRFVFDKLGSFEQLLIREVFAGELSEKMQCQVCGTVKAKNETFTDLVLPVPPEEMVLKMGQVPTTQNLLDKRLQFEVLDEDNLVFCESCQKNMRHGKWTEIVSPPAHLCVCLNRFTFDMQTMAFSKEKTPVQIDGTVQIGPYQYHLYMVIVHTGKTASSGHYYAVGRRSEDPQGEMWTMDDSQLKPADPMLLQGGHGEKQKDDNPYVLFYRCLQAPPTPPVHIPKALLAAVQQEDLKRDE